MAERPTPYGTGEQEKKPEPKAVQPGSQQNPSKSTKTLYKTP